MQKVGRITCALGMITALQNEDWWKSLTEGAPLGVVEVRVDGLEYWGTPERLYKGERQNGQLTAEGADGVRYVLTPKVLVSDTAAS